MDCLQLLEDVPVENMEDVLKLSMPEDYEEALREKGELEESVNDDYEL